MSVEKFSVLEDDLKTAVDRIKRSVDTRILRAHGEERKQIVREVERMNDEAQNLIQGMELEIQKSPTYERSDLRSRLASCKTSLDKSMDNLRSFVRDVTDVDDMEAHHRSRLMAGTRILQSASNSVQRSRQIAAETDEIGVNIIGELDRQGEALERTRDRLHDTQGALGKSRTILRGMAIRVITNKLIMAVIILLELGILAGVIYWKFFS